MMSDKQNILPSAYFGPVQYFARFTRENSPVIEQHDHYLKQTYRNRCIIAGANGPLILTIPVKRKKGKKTLMKDIRIDYDTNWQKLHYRGILSAYRSSPFFEFYFDEIEPFYRKKFNFLIDLNVSATKIMLGQLGIRRDIFLSDHFEKLTEDEQDLRELISPKRNLHEDQAFQALPYNQVFIDKLGFIPNLSILDLVFNEGPESLRILKDSLRDR